MIGEKIRCIRVGKGLTQSAVCNGICDRSMLSHIENEKVMPSVDLLGKLCNRLGVPTSEILSDNSTGIEAKKILDELQDMTIYGAVQDAIQFGLHAMSLKVVQNDLCALSKCMCLVGTLYNQCNDFNSAYEFFRQASKLSVSCDVSLQIRSLNGTAAVLVNLRQFDDGLKLLTHAYDLSTAAEAHNQTRIWIVYNLAKVHHQLKASSQSLHYVNEGLYLCKRTGIFDCAGHLESLLGLLHLEQCHFDQAYESFQRALHFYHFVDDQTGVTGCLVNLSETLAAQGKSNEALRHLDAALVLTRVHHLEQIRSLVDETILKIQHKV